jgi:hypothetical protein
VLKVQASSLRIRVAGRVRAASNGRVRVAVRANGRVRARSAAVRADGSFTLFVRRPAGGRFRVVTRYLPHR